MDDLVVRSGPPNLSGSCSFAGMAAPEGSIGGELLQNGQRVDEEEEEESAAIRQLRTMRVSPNTRKTYASSTSHLLRYLWGSKRHLLTQDFMMQFADAAGMVPADAPAARELKQALPGFREDGGVGPAPLKWSELKAADFMDWMVELKNAGGLHKSAVGSKRSALYNLYQDYRQGEVYETNLKQDLTQLAKGLTRQLAEVIREGECKHNVKMKPIGQAGCRSCCVAAMCLVQHQQQQQQQFLRSC